MDVMRSQLHGVNWKTPVKREKYTAYVYCVGAASLFSLFNFYQKIEQFRLRFAIFQIDWCFSIVAE